MRMTSSITAATAVIVATMVVSARADTRSRLLNMSEASNGQVHFVADRGDGGRRGGQGDGGSWNRGDGGDRGGRGSWSGGWDGGRNRGGWDGDRNRGGWDSGWGRSGFYFGLSPNRYGYGYGYPSYSYGYSRPYYGYNYGYSTPSYGYSYSQPSYSYDGGYTTGYWQGSAANPAATAEPIRSRVVNPADNQATLRYSVNGRQYSIRPGEQHDFTEPGPGVIEFDRGNNAGFVQYRLSGGVYTFSPTDRGWELFRSQGDIAAAQ